MSDPFSLLGLPAQFDLKPADIAARKRELSRALHPDRYVGRPASERREALSKALSVNDAARVLENPITRAEALLGKFGHQLEEGKEAQPDPEFLMEIMELRQELRAAGQEKDVAAVEKLAARVDKDRQQVTQKLQQCLDGLGQPGFAFDQDQAFSLLGTLRYFRRFSDEANAILDELV